MAGLLGLLLIILGVTLRTWAAAAPVHPALAIVQDYAYDELHGRSRHRSRA
jgi:hypothetical protein